MLRIFRFAVLAVALAASIGGASGEATAQDLNQLRAQGVIGERFDGFAAARRASAAATKVVNQVNAQRRTIYRQRAAKQGIPAAQVGQVYAKQIMKNAPAGTWFQAANGKWSRK